MGKKEIAVMKNEKDLTGLTVATMPVNTSKPLDTTAKNRLSLIITEAFAGQTTRYQMELDKKKLEIEEQYRKHCQVDKILKERTDLQERDKKLTEKLEELGFTSTGDIRFYTANDAKLTPKGRLAKANLEALQKESNPIFQLRDKYLTRLYMSTTMGEAAVIMREVLGNNQLPDVKMSDLDNK